MSEFEKKREELLATYHAIGTDVMVVPVEEYNKLRKQLDRTELAEAKVRMENERLRAVLEFYADQKNHTEPRGTQIFGDVFYDKGIIARQALAGESNA